MGKKDPRIDSYIEAAAPFARPILQYFRAAVHEGCPDVEETIKWGAPHFDYHGIMCSMAAFKQHCAFGFWKAALLPGLAKKRTEAMGQFGRVASVDDLPARARLVTLVREAAKLNAAGVSVPRVRKPRPALQPPADLLAGIRKNVRAAATWKQFPPGHQREYVEWILEAKTAPTRAKRLATTLDWLAEGKPRNWKYQAK